MDRGEEADKCVVKGMQIYLDEFCEIKNEGFDNKTKEIAVQNINQNITQTYCSAKSPDNRGLKYRTYC